MNTDLKESQIVKIACFEDGGGLLKKGYKEKWSEGNPTLGYCYIVSEALFHYGNLKNPKPYVHNYGGDVGTHWWLVEEDGHVVDYTQDQFDFEVDHVNEGRRATFFKGTHETPRGHCSKRGYKMAQRLGLV